jgi:hypothetical protein
MTYSNISMEGINLPVNNGDTMALEPNNYETKSL